MIPVSAVVTDIEGTTTPIAFVHRTLFPYARARLAGFLDENAGRPDVAAELALIPGDPLETLFGWMDRDEKAGPLKALQGMIWRQGYLDGALIGELYADVPPALRRWSQAGLRLAVYSSGSEEAQRLLFRHAEAGDLTGLFAGFFDTRVGPKRDPSSYAAIAAALGRAARETLFLSDVEAELDAAAAAGWRVCQLVRREDGTLASARHPVAPDFASVTRAFMT
jgi:enolase-phosphatase E1